MILQSSLTKDLTVYTLQSVNEIITVTGFEEVCYEFSILELWAQNGRYNDSTFEKLTEADILYKINNVNRR